MGNTTAATAAAAAKKRAATHCRNGHEYTPDNTYVRPDNGRRVCRTCAGDAKARFNAWLDRRPIVERTMRQVGVRAF